MDVLEPQIKGKDQVQVLITTFNRELTLGQNRQWMLENASGEYVAFLDDDDLVSTDYVESILPLLDGVDYIGFQLQFYCDGEKQKLTHHSLKYEKWHDDEVGYYRNISHLNPIKRDLALRIPMEGGRGEDFRWAEKLWELDLVKTEHFIPKVMYHYLWRSVKDDGG